MISALSHPLADLIESGIGDGCGCPEEYWLFNGIDLIIHFDAEHADAFLDGGDWGEADTRITGADPRTTRALVFSWAERLTTGEGRGNA